MNLDYNVDSENELKENFIQSFSNYLYEEKMKNQYSEIIFLCVGTDRIIGDCFGPLVGSKLKAKLEQYNIFNIFIYGTLKENLCYTNIQDIVKLIEKEHKNACIVVIDAALSKKERIGKIFVDRGKTILGNGLNKKRVEVGSISIKAVVGKDYKIPNYNFTSLQNISLNVVVTLSNIVAEGICEVIKYI